MAEVGFITDPLAGLKYHKDTSYFLMQGACELGHRIYQFEADKLYWDQRQLKANALEVELDQQQPPHYRTRPMPQLVLDQLDLIIMRSDPPFDRSYFYATLLLDRLKHAQVVNPPASLRDWNEKMAILDFPEHIAATSVMRHADDVRRFVHEHEHTVLKPLDGFGGRGIVFLHRDQPDLDEAIQTVTQQQRHWIMCQQYLESADQGDKRILLLDGEPLGAVLRLHASGKKLNNLDAGGHAVAASVSPRERAICAEVGAACRAKKVRFVGADFIGERLIEINLTSPTCLREMAQFDAKPLHTQVIARLLQPLT